MIPDKPFKLYYSLPEAEKCLNISRWRILNLVIEFKLKVGRNNRNEILLSSSHIEKLKQI